MKKRIPLVPRHAACGWSLMCLVACGDPTPMPSDDLSTGTFTLTLDHDGLQREAIVHVPPSIDAGQPAPVLLNFHGYGGTSEDHMAAADFRNLADTHGFVLAYPQGSLLEGSPHWNAALPGGDNKSNVDDLGFVTALLDEISVAYPLDASRTYAIGYSNGGMMSFALACYRNDRIAAVGSISGTMLEGMDVDCTTTHPTSVITIHGTADEVLPYQGTEGYLAAEAITDFWQDINQTDPREDYEVAADDPNVTSFVARGGELGSEVQHVRVQNGGHVWLDVSFGGTGTNELLWGFLSRFSTEGVVAN